MLHFRFADKGDMDLYFRWANDPLVRLNSYDPVPIPYENHINWFNKKVVSGSCFFYLFFNEENEPVGQVRIDKSQVEIVIGISIDEAFRGKSLGAEMLEKSSNHYLQQYPSATVVAYIKVENTPSCNIFKKAGFTDEEIVTEQGYKSYKLYKKLPS